MKKILSVIVVLGQVLTGASAAVLDDQPTALTPEEVRAATQELQALKSNILEIQQKIKEHQERSELSAPPSFCKRFVGDPNAANLDLIRTKQTQIAKLQREHDDCADDAKKAELTIKLTTLKSTFDNEMEKKAQYEAAVTTLLSLKAELDSCIEQMQAIVQKVSRDKP